MDKVRLVLGIRVSEGTTKIEVLERADEDPGIQRPALIEPHVKAGGGHDYYTVIDAWEAPLPVDEEESKPKEADE